jgi:amino acid adenylation domain-containing protein
MQQSFEGFCLSPQQRRLWLAGIQRRALWNAEVAIGLDGPLRRNVLERALTDLVARHQILRTTFRCPSGMKLPLQVISEAGRVELREDSLSDLDPAQRDERVAGLFWKEPEEPWDLENGLSLRASLLTLAPESHVLLATVSPLCADGGTLDRLVAELGEAYAAALNGGKEQDTFQYARFADWQNMALQEEDEDGREFWTRHPVRSAAKLSLPGQREPTSLTAGGRFESVTSNLPLSQMRGLEDLADRLDSSLSTLLLTLWLQLLGRLSGEPEIVVGDLYSFRDDEVLEKAFGLLAKYLPVGVRLQKDLRFTELLADVEETRSAVRDHADGFIWEDAGGEVAPIPAAFEFDDWPVAVSAGDVVFSLKSHRACVDSCTLKLSCARSAEWLRLELQYDPDCFDREDVERLARQLETFVQKALQDPECLLSDFELLGEAEQWEISAHHAGTEIAWDEELFPRLFEHQAAKSPASLAVVVEDQRLGYGELNTRANRLAHGLRALGVGPETLVALCTDRSLDLIVGMLGILKAGGAYVPLDPDQPTRRLASILEDCGALVLLTQSHIADTLPPTRSRIVRLDADRELFATCPDHDPDTDLEGETLAYVVFTSGSTGRPKGVAVEHRQLRNYIHGAIQRLDLPPQASFATVSTFAADLGNTMIFPALASGGCLHVVSHDRATDPEALAEYFGHQGIDCLKIVPSHLASLLAFQDPIRILPRKRLILGGEVSSWGLVAKIQEMEPTCQVFNHYGPTETTVGVATHPVRLDARDPRCLTVPIGRPLPNTRLYLLDSQMRPVPYWVAGDLYVGGESLSRGYLDHPDLTAASFVPALPDGPPGARLYRTGDVARRLPDGSIEFLSRKDLQIKYHGFRIELNEIRTALNEFPQVRDSIVLVLHDQDQRPVLVAYYVCRQEIDPAAFRDFLRERLIEAAIPSFFMRLKRLPLTLNGKINYEVLPPLEEVKKQVRRAVVPPRTPVEELLVGLWSEILGAPTVGAEDNFFELGGHSLLATQLISRVRQACRVELPLRSLFETPTVAGLAAQIEKAAKAGADLQAPLIEPVERTGVLPASYAQERLWAMHQLEPDSPAYNIPVALQVTGDLRIPDLVRSLREIVRRHEVLRTSFADPDGRPVQVIASEVELSLWLVDLSGLEEARRSQEARRLAREDARLPFDLVRGPLFRTGLVRLDAEEHLALFTMHHIVSDAWSMDILVRELTALYNAFSSGRPLPLADLKLQYADFACWQHRYLQERTLEAQMQYWRRQLQGAPEVLQLPTDRPRAGARALRGGTLVFEMPLDLAGALRKLSRQEGSTLFMTLLAAFKVLLYRLTGQRDLVVGTDVANRNQIEMEGLIGFFVNNLALRTDLSGNPSFRELLQRVRNVSLEAYAHQDLPFDRLVHALKVRRTLSHTPLFQVLFVHQNAPSGNLELQGLRLRRVMDDAGLAKFDLAVFIRERGEMLSGEWTFSTDLFERNTIERMSEQFQRLLQCIVEDPETSIDRLEMISDTERERQIMEKQERQTTELRKLRSVQRKSVDLQEMSVVRTEPAIPGESLPLIVRPVLGDVDLVEWALENRASLESWLLQHGALLFRGFGIRTIGEFERFAQTLAPDLYAEYGDLPSEQGGTKVYQSTPYPADQSILFHHESSHMHLWPTKQWFFCVTAAREGGETPIVDGRKIYALLPPDVVETFERKGLMYVRRFIEGFDVTWQEFFRTDSQEAVEIYCRANGVELEWQDGMPRTRQICPAVIRHPKTGESVFFNQILLHHPFCLEPEIRDYVLSAFQDDLPRNVAYGDGSPIEDELVEQIRRLYWDTSVSFPWQEGDVLMVDNMLVAHARKPFIGPRKIVVAMGEMFHKSM